MAAPKIAISHIQKIAPGPPIEIASAMPAMLPVPTREAAEIQKALNEEIDFVPSLFSPGLSPMTRNISGSIRSWTTPVRMVR
ncbi:Uncharacterised protein [Mycobacteroides abscessus subsp. abscessus]|nr:Uncharacterised protein [Mycobacteroides abscessus subsp. abscessus]